MSDQTIDALSGPKAQRALCCGGAHDMTWRALGRWRGEAHAACGWGAGPPRRAADQDRLRGADGAAASHQSQGPSTLALALALALAKGSTGINIRIIILGFGRLLWPPPTRARLNRRNAPTLATFPPPPPPRTARHGTTARNGARGTPHPCMARQRAMAAPHGVRAAACHRAPQEAASRIFSKGFSKKLKYADHAITVAVRDSGCPAA